MPASNNLKKRPPIVVVMGHVDHGKTTLLDYIKKTNIAAKEAGGITQSIGAYEITHNGEKITFIDTPGHEAFSKMRARGTKVADIALLVVAADDGVKPQTKDAHRIIKESETPFIVVINKIDKNNADVNRVKSELAQEGIMLEGFGGNISFKEISAKKGDGVEELLDLILLTAEIEGLTYDPQNPAKGFILESHIDSRRGIVASAIATDGILKEGDMIGGVKIRSLEDFLGKRIKQAEPSAPALILGFAEVPEIGMEFIVGEGSISTVNYKSSEQEIKEGALNIIIKASDTGSLEALTEVINNLPLPENVSINIVNQSVGDVSDGDAKLAINTGALIIGFKVKEKTATEDKRLRVITSDIIYELIQKIEEWLKKTNEHIVAGDLEVLAVFGKKGGNKQIIGGKIAEGYMQNNSHVAIVRGGKELGGGKIVNLQKDKKDANRVEADNECGLMVSAEIEIKIGDHLIIK